MVLRVGDAEDKDTDEVVKKGTFCKCWEMMPLCSEVDRHQICFILEEEHKLHVCTHIILCECMELRRGREATRREEMEQRCE